MSVYSTQEAMNEQLKLRLERTVTALRANRMDACWVQTKEEALEKALSLIPADAVIASGGSMTLQEIGLIEKIKAEGRSYLDRTTVPPEEVKAMYRKMFSADVFLMSSNAITENGELYNVDGNGNRVAALIYGPDSVIVVAGANKIVPDINAAIQRVKRTAAPPNTARLHCDTPCSKTGVCAGAKGDLPAGCRSEQRICCQYVVSAWQRVPGRIKVILVAENLGY